MKIELTAGEAAIDIALDTIARGKQALVFADTKRSAEKSAEDISRKIKNAEFEKLEKDILNAVSSPTKQCKRLARCIRKGIAFHHAGLVRKQRELIEDAFREGAIKIICCTPTLAAGLDLPAFRTILKSLKRYGGNWGMDWIPVLEYLQMAGRAGRPSYDKFGEAIVLSKTNAEKEEVRDRYLFGEPEAIYSKLAVEPVLRTYILSLLATHFVRNKEQLLTFLEQTFWAHQYKDLNQLEMIVDKMLALLEQWEFIAVDGDFVSAADIGDKIIRATPVGRRVAELYIDPLTANQLIVGLRKATGRATAFSFLQLIAHTLEMKPLLRVKTKEYDDVQEKLAGRYDELLEQEPNLYDPLYDDFINSIKTALFLNAWADEESEDLLLENYAIRPGEIRVKLETADWLLYASGELAKLLRFQPLLKEIMKLRLRLKYGVREQLLPLLKLEGIGRVRARRLYTAGIKDIGRVKKVDIMRLSQLLGRKTALNVKKQLGQETGLQRY